jgi:hypothetical protein
MKKISFSFLAFLILTISANAQQTVGLFHTSDSAYSGYTLFGPKQSEKTYLIDNCGELKYSWNSPYKSGGSVQLLDNGLLLRTCVYQNGSPINGGGAGGKLIAIQPDQLVAWELDLANDTIRQHHDFSVLPNGNIITIVWELKNENAAILQGRDSSLVAIGGLWPDYLLEYNPTTDSVVWEWHAWDHLIQDYDPTMNNFGVVADHPELFNLNFSGNGYNPDWLHLNSVDYNTQLDQIIISSPLWNEIFIIDHSTTTTEAATHAGGTSGKGGDILWRWGNPITYDLGDSTDQVFYFQHDAHWIPQGHPDENKIILFNNGRGRTPAEYSAVEIIEPTILPSGEYDTEGDGTFSPATQHYTFTSPTPTDFFSRIISSADQLPNGNILIDEGTQGHFFEIDSMENIVWDYVNPVVTDSIMTQEQIVPGAGTLLNACFRARRLSLTDPALAFLTLQNFGPIELDPYPSTCVVGINESENNPTFNLYPNPARSSITIEGPKENYSYQLINLLGVQSKQGELTNGIINIEKLSPGIYYLILSEEISHAKTYTLKFIKL